jgi:hypothetical protein
MNANKDNTNIDKLSCSMIIDSGIITSNNLLPKKPDQWIKDDDVKRCYSCNIKFSMWIRKHHCRSCGRIFCDSCCNERIIIDKKLNNFDKQSRFKKYFDKQLYGNCVRVCCECKKTVEQFRTSRHLDLIFSYLNLNDIRNAGFTCLKWKEIAVKYISEFRYIQYYFPDHIFSKRERNLLWTHRKSFCGHSKLLIQLIKSQHNKINNLMMKEIINIINDQKKIKCKYLYCSRDCHEKISSIEILELLHFDNIHIKQLVANLLGSIDNEELLLYLPTIVIYIKNNIYLEDLLIEKSLLDIKIRYNYYWLLTTYSDNKLTRRYSTPYVNIKNKLISILKTQLREEYNNLINTELFIMSIKNCCENEKEEYIKKNIIRIYDKFKEKGIIYCPINPNFKILKIYYNKITIKDSATRPIYIPMLCIDNNNKKKKIDIIIKKEDVRKDQIILNVINIVDKILKHNNVRRNICTYNVIPISSESGIIEIVRKAETIYNIVNKKKFSLQNYINENNPNKSVKDIQDNFLISVSSYCVITYLLGVGDRHLNNIMITKDGTLFHIDYGYIMGLDPKYRGLTDSMKITPEMINTFGGINSKNYEKFKSHSSEIYNCLRRHISLFIILLSPLVQLSCESNDISRNEMTKIINKEIIKRFIPGMTYKEAEIKVYNIIGNSQGSYSHKLMDKMYYINRESNIFYGLGIFSDYLGSIFSLFYSK